MTAILIEPGQRTGKTLANEPEMRAKLHEGYEVYFLRNGVYFRVTQSGDALKFSAMAQKPAGI